jgi:hypothetical protein
MNRLLLLLVLGACGSSSITSSNDAPIGSDIDARPPGSCTRASDCAPGNICNPANGMCVTSLPCTTHAECGGEAHCTPGGTCAPSMTHDPCDNDQNCIGQEACNPDTHICGCGGQPLSTAIVIPNMLIAIDRSDSMRQAAGSGGSKWNVAKAAVGTIVDMFGDRIRFGLDLWPGTDQYCTTGGDCSGGAVFVDVGPNTAGPIKDFLLPITDANEHLCNFGTPIGTALTFIGGYSGLKDTSHNNYVLFMTDGIQNCTADNALDAVDNLLASTPPVPTFVVGFGTGVNAMDLNALAQHGGRPRAGDPKYYTANDPTTLVTAFQEIVGAVLSCTFTLSAQPNDPNRLFVYFDENPIPRDASHTNGWDYDAASMTLSFYGAICEQVKAGTSGALAVSYGCPVIP